MKTTEEFKNYNCRNSFKKIFDFKGEIAPIAEKASRNLELKMKNRNALEQRVHYFAVGHTFKHIDKETLFNFVVDDETQRKEPTKFLSLQSFDTSFCNELLTVYFDKNEKKHKGLIYDIRNINSHYIHRFEKINVDQFSATLISFIKESFELALVQIFFNEEVKKQKDLSFKAFLDQDNYDRQLVQFLCDRFYPVGNKETYPDDYLDYRKQFRNLTKEEAIDSLLFVEAEQEFDWMLFETHCAFRIEKGKYLSFYGCLFLLSMFLYKSEANQLISKIKGFKRTQNDDDRSKRDIFTFLAKRFSSQDIDSEENNLVKFRDLIQYLNKYPVEWNSDMELESKHQAMTEKLKAEIIEMEIDRSFPQYIGNERFHIFAKYRIWGKKYFGKKIEKEYVSQSFSSAEFEDYSYEIDACPELKGAHVKLADLKSISGLYGKRQERNDREIRDTELAIKKLENQPNPIAEKLKTRIEKNMLFVSYGRNQDRFMVFAARFLAESHYFGKDAQFKMYQFFTTDEQNNEYEDLKRVKTKKEIDKLKYHQGKMVHFSTYDNHHSRYESWDTPYVIENNAVQVKITLAQGCEKIVSIQRSLMIYLLEHALYNQQPENIEGAGKYLISDYFAFHQLEFHQSKLVLEQNGQIDSKQKSEFKKLLPKRLLHHYSPAVQNYQPEFTTLQLILEKAKLFEERYKKLSDKAKEEGNYDDFIKRNKGKQFKLQFIRKAWHLMFFRDSYDQMAKFSGHHKRFNIERDEFNDFSRFMFAFDEVPAYKDYLKQMLDKKGFFENQQFKSLFDQGRSLDEFYNKTKLFYQKWIETAEARSVDKEKYTLQNYERFFGDQMFYINLSHFIAYLESKSILQRNEQGQMNFNATENCQFLIPAYYYTNKLEKTEYSTNRKLFNQLRSVKLEDALLYEMAMRYLKFDQQIVQQAKKPIIKILNQNIEFVISKGQVQSYKLIVPINKIDSYVALIKLKEEQEAEYNKSSFLINVVKYIEMVRLQKDMKPIYEKLTAKTVSFDDLGKIDNHLVSASEKFTNLALTLEQYYVVKNGLVIQKDNRITIGEISALKDYFNSWTRNKAFHFAIPDDSYINMTKKIESLFIEKEIKPLQLKSYKELPRSAKAVCNILLTTNHNEFFGREKDGITKREEAERRYFNEVICK